MTICRAWQMCCPSSFASLCLMWKIQKNNGQHWFGLLVSCVDCTGEKGVLTGKTHPGVTMDAPSVNEEGMFNTCKWDSTRCRGFKSILGCWPHVLRCFLFQHFLYQSTETRSRRENIFKKKLKTSSHWVCRQSGGKRGFTVKSFSHASSDGT